MHEAEAARGALLRGAGGARRGRRTASARGHWLRRCGASASGIVSLRRRRQSCRPGRVAMGGRWWCRVGGSCGGAGGEATVRCPGGAGVSSVCRKPSTPPPPSPARWRRSAAARRRWRPGAASLHQPRRGLLLLVAAPRLAQLARDALLRREQLANRRRRLGPSAAPSSRRARPGLRLQPHVERIDDERPGRPRGVGAFEEGGGRRLLARIAACACAESVAWSCMRYSSE